MTIKIFDLIGQRCLTKENGETLLKAIIASFEKGESITIDFSDVKQFASPFFNNFTGILYSKYDPNKINSTIKLINLTEVGALVNNRVIENALILKNKPDIFSDLENILKQQEGNENGN